MISLKSYKGKGGTPQERHGNAGMLENTEKRPLAFHVPGMCSSREEITVAKEFQKHLKTLGYHASTSKYLPAHIREFLEQQEIKGKNEISVTTQDIKEHYEYLQIRPNRRRGGGLSSMMIQKHIYALRLFFHWQHQTGAIKTNPMSSLIFPSPEAKPREILTQSEIREMYKNTETQRDKAILGILYGCGLRKSESENLNISDIHFRENLLYVRKGKGRKRRVIPLTARVSEDLKKYFYDERSNYIKAKTEDNEQAFILNKTGNRMKGQGYYVRIKELIKITKNEKIKFKNIGLHGLRHSIATHLLENGVKVEYVRDFLGHEYLETTKIYTRVSEKQLTSIF